MICSGDIVLDTACRCSATEPQSGLLFLRGLFANPCQWYWAISLNMGSSGKGAAPSIENVKCDATKGQTGRLPSAPVSAWYWSATLSNVPGGILDLIVTEPVNAAGDNTMVILLLSLRWVSNLIHCQGHRSLFLRKGAADNVMVPENDYDKSGFTFINGHYEYTLKAYGAVILAILVKLGWIGRSGKTQRQ